MSTVFEVSVNDKMNYESHNNDELNDALNYVPQEVNVAAQLPQYPDPTCFLLDKLSLDGSILSEEAKILLKNIILKHSQAFVRADGIIGHYKGKIKHRIDLLDPSKIAKKPHIGYHWHLKTR